MSSTQSPNDEISENVSKYELTLIFVKNIFFIAVNIFKLAKNENIAIKNNVENLNKLQEDLERQSFIQDMLNHANMEFEINEKMAYINRIIEKYSDSADGYYYRGEFYIKFDKFYSAIRDFEKTIGKEVEIKFFAPEKGKKYFEGVLKGYDENNVIVEENGKDKKIPLSKIAKINLAIKFD